MITKRGMLFALAILSLVLIQFNSVSANQLIIETARPDYGMVVRLVDPNDRNIEYGTAYGTTEATGIATIEYSTNKAELGFFVMLVDDGKIKESKLFEGPYTIQPTIELSFFNRSREEIPEEPVENTEATTEEASSDTETETAPEAESELTEETEQAAGIITGNAISSEFLQSQNVAYYMIAAVALAGLIGFFLLRKFGSVTKQKTEKYSPPPTTEFTGPSTSKAQQALSQPQNDINDRDARRIKQLEREIELLKRKEQFKQAEEEYQKAQKELNRLYKDRK